MLLDIKLCTRADSHLEVRHSSVHNVLRYMTVVLEIHSPQLAISLARTIILLAPVDCRAFVFDLNPNDGISKPSKNFLPLLSFAAARRACCAAKVFWPTKRGAGVITDFDVGRPIANNGNDVLLRSSAFWRCCSVVETLLWLLLSLPWEDTEPLWEDSWCADSDWCVN